jgi:anthranilate synthase/aminodeoxychorismate synthase-like glutamine amidotransferase
MILLIDNYDSFTYNLYQYISELGVEVEVIRNDRVTLEEIRKSNYAGIVLSPGPGDPSEAGVCLEVVKELHKTHPILGICLGHQTIGEAFGGKIVRGEKPIHGKVHNINHSDNGLYKGLPNPFKATRYHSLIIEKETLPSELEVTCQTEDGVIMGVKHKDYPIEGIQFHPESYLTESGKDILNNFIKRFNS